MFRGLIIAAVLLLAGAGSARADWVMRTGEDPMTDKKWVAMVSMFGQFAVMFKCWAGGSTQIGILVGPYLASVPYKDIVEAKMRVDKAEPVEIALLPTEMEGGLVLLASSDVSEVIIPLLLQIGNAKQRVVLAMGTGVLQANAKGAAKGVQTMISTCGLN